MTRYEERLVPGWGTALGLLLLGPGVFVVVLPLRAAPLVPLLAAVAVTVAAEAVLFLSQPKVVVAGGELRAGAARIPVRLTGRTAAFRGDDGRTAKMRELDARAWTLLRGWVDPVLRIAITDPDDPVPYWLVSTRRPEALAAALADERAAVAAA